MSLYEELGVGKDATPAEVKRAYRKRAQQAHPDREGGSDEAFKRVNKAYVVLSDPAKRQRYDQTGEDTAEPLDSAQQQATQAIASILFQVLEREDVDYTDIVGTMRRIFTDKIKEHKRAAQQVEEATTKAERTLKRFKRKGQGENLLAMMLQGRIDQLRMEAEDKARAVKVGETALGMLEDYSYEADPQQVQPVRGKPNDAWDRLVQEHMNRYGWRNT